MRFFMSLIDQEADISLPWRHDQSTHECGAAHDIYCIYDYQSDFSRLSPNEADPPFVQYFDSPPPKRSFLQKIQIFQNPRGFFGKAFFARFTLLPKCFTFPLRALIACSWKNEPSLVETRMFLKNANA